MDWEVIGRGIHQLRVLRGESQEKLARLAGLGVSTIYNAEQGKAIGRRSLLKICAVFEIPIEELLRPKQVRLTPESGGVVHRYAASVWVVAADRRTTVPPDDFARIQSAEERLRLGRLGLVTTFCTTTSFIMPHGPGLIFVELFHRFEGAVNEGLYRECTVRCEQGRLRICIAGEAIELAPGDVVGYYAKDMEWAEPAEPVGPTGFPVVFTWTGAVRTGGPPPGSQKT
jgi:transcriptional regulator with XRE-family HTH domain